MKLVLARARRARSVLVSLLGPLVVLSLAGRARAAPESAMDAANRAFAEGRSAAAAEAFEGLVAERGYSAPLLFNLGNAYLRDDKPVRAMLAYERADLLAPRDEAIARNLAVARAAASVTEDRGPVARISRALTMDTYAWLAAGGFWIGAFALGAASLSKRRRGLLLAAAACAAITASAPATALVVASRDLDRGLVMTPAPVRVSPFESAQSDFALAPGSSVELGQVRDDYVFARDSRGRTGWIERAQVEALIPHSS